jgi:hypothetical protein
MYFIRLVTKIIGHSARTPHAARHSRRVGVLVRVTAALATISAVDARVTTSAKIPSVAPPALTFARYVAFLDRRDVFTEAGPVAVEISASLPSQGTRAYVAAIRETGASERSEYDMLQLEGDSALAQVVVGPFLSAQAQAEALPLSSVLITPMNYKFHCIGPRYRFGTLSYVFQIRPRKRHVGLIKGQLWIDAETGVPLRETGYFVKTPAKSLRRIDITCDVNLHEGVPYQRITHAVIDIARPMRRAELTVTESPLSPMEEESSQ